MSTGIQLNQARAAYEAVGGVDYFTYDDFLAALRLYLNPAPVVCKNCGKIEAQHHRLNMPHENVGFPKNEQRWRTQ